MKQLLLFLAFASFGWQGAAGQAFTLVAPAQKATIYLSASEPGYLRLAVDDLVADVRRITGQTLPVVSRLADCRGHCVVVGTVTNAEAGKVLNRFDPALSGQLAGKWEAYRVQSAKGKAKPVTSALLVAGSDARGTMFALYDFIEKYLAVDPMHYWSDLAPARQESLAWEKVNIEQAEPAFRYRGWFINDEDLLTEWVGGGGRRNIDYPFYKQVVSPEVIKHVFEAMVRLRMNLVIPASFIDILNPAEARLVQEAARRGLFLSMHHVEPMGVSAFTFFNYWAAKNGTKPLFSFYSSRRELEEVWRVYAEEWAKYPDVIWQIGLRGIADRPMWLADPGIPQTDADRGKLISEAMRVQMNMIREVDKRPAPPVTTTLWAEGAMLNQDGFLQIPAEATVVFADNSPGWKWQPDFYETKREPSRRYGVYYHHQLWGSGPHLAQAVPPGQTYRLLREAFDRNAHQYAIFNVSNVREFALGVDATSKMVYDLKGFDPDAFLRNWCEGRFGKAAGQAQQAYRLYLGSYQVHRRQQVPFLLDGQTRVMGRNLLNQLSLQITEPVRFAQMQKTEKPATPEATWGKRFLGDMHPTEPDLHVLLPQVRAQQQGLEAAGTAAEEALTQMTEGQQEFFRTNLVAHQRIILGLTHWLEAIIQAKQAEDSGNRAQTRAFLQQARDAFKTIRAGQQLNTQGEKWEHWYRGDKKMNLHEMEALTAKVQGQAG